MLFPPAWFLLQTIETTRAHLLQHDFNSIHQLPSLRYSLHKSLSAEADTRDHFRSAVDAMQVQLEERDGDLAQAHNDREKLTEQLYQLQREKEQLEDDVRTAEEKVAMSAKSEHK